MFEQLIEMMESISRSGILYLIVAPLLLAVFIALRISGNRIRKLTQLQKASEQSLKELNKKLADEKVKVDRVVTEERGKIERLLIEEKARGEKAHSEVEIQKEIARIAASISNEQANKLMVFANIAEEFRTPLTLITVPIENALSGRYGEIPTSLRGHLDAALGNIRHLSRLVSQFHDISRLQAGRIQLKPQRRNLVPFMREIVGGFQPYASKREIDLSFRATSESLDSYFDADKMEEVFYHLLSNAFRFTPARGKVAITISEHPGEQGTEDFLEIRVRDSGKGIPKSELPHMFDMLRKSEEGPEVDEARIAIGLSLVRELVSLHGGSIYVDSEVGSGTEFRILLPRGSAHFEGHPAEDDIQDPRRTPPRTGLDVPVLQHEKNAPSKNKGQKDQHILVVDDNPQIRELLKECLQDEYHVSEADDGKSALDQIKQTMPDLIISDVIMPGMDGFDLCRALKTDENFRKIPVILLTAKASELMRVEGMKAGADDYIPKPFSPNDLLEKIKKLSSH